MKSVAASARTDARKVEEAKAFVKETQTRLKRVRGVSEDLRQRIKIELNNLRQSIHDRDLEEMEERKNIVHELVETYIAPHEKSWWREYMESIGIAILVALFLRAFVVGAFKIPSGSMIPTLLVGDHLFVNRLAYGLRLPMTNRYLFQYSEPTIGDVVVFSFPSEGARSHLANKIGAERACIDDGTLGDDKDMIKRVVGVPGDIVEIDRDQLRINGQKAPRTFLRRDITGDHSFPYEILEREEWGEKSWLVRFLDIGQDFGPVTVEDGHVFVIGDNRDNSSDGRCWGQVPIQNIKGRATIIWFSYGPDGVRAERFGKRIR